MSPTDYPIFVRLSDTQALCLIECGAGGNTAVLAQAFYGAVVNMAGQTQPYTGSLHYYDVSGECYTYTGIQSQSPPVWSCGQSGAVGSEGSTSYSVCTPVTNVNDSHFYNWKQYTGCPQYAIIYSITTASSGDTTSNQRQGSYDFWIAMGQPSPGEFVSHNGICWEYIDYSGDLAPGNMIEYDVVQPNTTLTTTQVDCAACIANMDYHLISYCATNDKQVPVMNTTGSTAINAAENAAWFAAQNPTIGGLYDSGFGACYEYLGLGSAFTAIGGQHLHASYIPHPSFPDCTCGVASGDFHTWEKCENGEGVINIVTTGVSNDSAANIAFYTSVYSPNIGQVVNFDTSKTRADQCYEYKGPTSSAESSYQNILVGTTSNHDTCPACITPPTSGCMDTLANNYDASATTDDGSCTYDIYGCTDPTAQNYDPTATIDDGSCITCLYGCTDATASNYNTNATCDDGSCSVVEGGTACDIQFGANEQCLLDGTSTITVDLSNAGGLANITTTVAGTPFGVASGCQPPGTIDITGLLEGETIQVQGECSYTKEDYDASAGGGSPGWAFPDCGESQQAISNDTKVYVYYDGTSLGSGEAIKAYKAVMKWLLDLSDFTVDTVVGSPTQNVYHTAVAGERWLDWGTAAMTGKFCNRQTNQPFTFTRTGFATSTVNPGVQGNPGSASATFMNQTTWQVEQDPYSQNNGVAPWSKMIDIINWSHDTATANTGGVSWTVDQFYDTAEGPLIGTPVPNHCSTGGCTSTGDNGSQLYLGHPPACGGNDTLVICFADESLFCYHGGGSPNFQQGMTNDAYVNGSSNYAGLYLQQPTLFWQDDYDEFIVNRNAHIATGKSFKGFLYPSKPSGGCNSLGGHKQLPMHALAAIHSGNNTPADGMWQTGTSPSNGCNTSGSKMDLIETENPYWTGTTPTYGGLDQHGWGINVDEVPFAAATFVSDLTVFLGSGGTQTLCDGSQCLKIKAVDESGVPISNYPITVNGISVGSTDAGGIVTHTLTTAGSVVINGCYTFAAVGLCVQSLITVEISTAQYSAARNCILGCTHPDSWNYNPLAGIDDGSCMHPLTEERVLSGSEICKIDTECKFATDVYNLYKYQRYGLDKGCLYNMDGHATKKYSTDWTDNLLPDYGAETFNKTLHTKDATPTPDWVVTACGEQEDPLTVYFYYDCTSLSQSAVTQARTANESWLDDVRASRALSAVNQIEGNCTSKNINESIPGHCPPTASNSTVGENKDNSITVYHTLVFGERWVDWGTSAMTGEFNNNGEFNNKYCGGACSPSGQHLTSNGAIDACIPDCGGNHDQAHFWSTLIYDTPTRLWYNAGGNSYSCTTCIGNSTGTDNWVASNPYTGTLNGEAPMPKTDNVLAVVFADESAVGPSAPLPANAYTYAANGEYGDGSPKGNPTWINAMDGVGTTCTDCYKNDYDKFISTYLTWKGSSSTRNINFFLYPSKPASVAANGAHNIFPLHALGAVSSGNQTVKNGTWTAAPTCSISDLTPVVGSNPYYAESNSTTNHVTNGRLDSGYGGLDQYGWGINVGMIPFTKEDFGIDLNAFWDSSVCNDSECLLIKIVDKITGKPIPGYPIVIDGLDAGKTNEFGILRTCIDNASIKTDHKINLCHCFYTTGGCNQQKLTITVDGVNCDDCGNIKMF